MNADKLKRSSRTLKGTLLTVLVGGSMSLLGASPARAAVLSFGNIPGGPYGGENCADVHAASLTNSTPVDAYNCTAALNQQFEFIGVTIYALGGQTCLDVESPDSMPVSGTLVDSYPCNGGINQQWKYVNGQIVNPASGGDLCLDATSGGQGTQLMVNTCTSAASQQWQIK
jgi:hypothetical protein